MSISRLHIGRSWLPALVLSILLLLFSGAARAGEVEEVNPDLAAQLFLKILSYDRNLSIRSGGRLVLAIVYRPDSPESDRIREGVQTAFQDRAGKFPVQGKTVSVTAVAFDAKTLTRRLQTAGATIIYVTPGLDDQTGSVIAAAQALKAPTLTGRRSLLDGGLAVAVVTNEDRPGIVINLPVAKALGMDLDPNLLRLAEVKR